MELILTHEQADFDAVAAQAAAHELNPTATPVLPRRANRNVRAYLTLYGDELPFVEPDDLPKEKIDRVTLVDTQSLITLRGMGNPPSAQVHVVDHHPLNRDLPEGWTASIAETGATTTLLIEELRERDAELSEAEATLMLLGIYEDTGGLSYLDTTPRDVLAAAWLLEQGASLAIANDFLHHPLTPDQRGLYERLLASAETHLLDGQTVVVACAEAKGMIEEISTLAHKLRDLFEPDALFILVQLESHVQLVARSTSDAIDVADIAAAFGGGGHNRAAAATIRDRPLAEARAKLLRLLPERLRPRATVAQIMSQGAHTLTPDVAVAQAAEIIRRYGYEGYPVVNGEQRQVIGLLTRRAVDRAMSHRMGQTPIGKIMEAGAVWVRPDDSVEHLQRVMTTHGWGQVPVVDAEKGEVIGIVTRTDLIKLLPAAREHVRRNVADLLESALTPARLALLRLIGETAREMRCSLFIVGGFARDLLLGTPSQDFDLVVEGDAIALARALARKHGGRVRSHSRFGTAKWLMAERKSQIPKSKTQSPISPPQSAISNLQSAIDFVSARTEFYSHPTALPQVERGSIKLDLHRRDFTINTLAVRLDADHFGELLDFWGGERDLRDRLVRVLHSISFVDDPTRILRAVRLEQRLGFRIEARTQELIGHALPLLDKVSGDRVRHELEFILAEAEPEKMLRRLAELDVLPHIHPALVWDEWVERKFGEARGKGQGSSETWQDLTTPSPVFLYYAMLIFRLGAAQLEAVLARLKFPRDRSDDLGQVVAVRDLLPRLASGLRPSQIVALLEDFAPRALAAVWLAADDPGARDAIANYLTRWRSVAPTVDGNTLKAMGLKPGPDFKRILRVLRDAWLDGQIADEAGERSLLTKLTETINGVPENP
ncbi:MAG: CBS domain-containing protein [Chloroflexi bacterium]|nr:CBS domain-containing protein [Chloroflexota bacterium]